MNAQWEKQDGGCWTASVWAPDDDDWCALMLAPMEGPNSQEHIGLFIDGDLVFSVASGLIDFMLGLEPVGILQWLAQREEAAG